MLKSELVELAVEARMSDAVQAEGWIDQANRRRHYTRRFNEMTKAIVEMWLDGFTSGDRARMAEANKLQNVRDRAASYRRENGGQNRIR